MIRWSDEDCKDTLAEVLREEYIYCHISPFSEAIELIEDMSPNIFNTVEGDDKKLFDTMGNFVLLVGAYCGNKAIESMRREKETHIQPSYSNKSKDDKAVELVKHAKAILDLMGYLSKDKGISMQHFFDMLVGSALEKGGEVANLFGAEYHVKESDSIANSRLETNRLLGEIINSPHDFLPRLRPFDRQGYTKKRLEEELNGLDLIGKSHIIKEFTTKINAT